MSSSFLYAMLCYADIFGSYLSYFTIWYNIPLLNLPMYTIERIPQSELNLVCLHVVVYIVTIMYYSKPRRIGLYMPFIPNPTNGLWKRAFQVPSCPHTCNYPMKLSTATAFELHMQKSINITCLLLEDTLRTFVSFLIIFMSQHVHNWYKFMFT